VYWKPWERRWIICDAQMTALPSTREDSGGFGRLWITSAASTRRGISVWRFREIGCCASAALKPRLDRSRATPIIEAFASARFRGPERAIFMDFSGGGGGNTGATRLTIFRQGRFVGKDDFGNTYYEQKKGVGPLGRPRRWVTYTDFAEASKVPAE